MIRIRADSVSSSTKSLLDYLQNPSQVHAERLASASKYVQILSFVLLGVFVRNVVRSVTTSDSSEQKKLLIVSGVTLSFLVASVVVAVAFRSADEELDQIEKEVGVQVLEKTEKPRKTLIQKEDGIWARKNLHHYYSEGNIDISRKAIAEKLAKPHFNFVTRKKNTLLELSREQMMTDILQLAARDELGVQTGGKHWQTCHYEAQGNVTVEAIVAEGCKWNCYRVSGVVSASPLEVAQLVTNDARIGDYDEMFDRIEFIERIDERSAIRRSLYKPVWPTQGRDFVINTTWEPLEDGRVIVATRSVDHPAAPPVRNYTRAGVLCAGYLCTPMESDGNLVTFLDVIVHTDLACDWLPPAVLNPLSNTKPTRFFQSIQRICEEEFPPQPLAIED